LGIGNVASAKTCHRSDGISRDTTAYTEGFLQPADETVRITNRLLERELFDPESSTTLKRYFLELMRLRDQFDGIYFGRADGSFLYASRILDETSGAYRIKRINVSPQRSVVLETYNEALRRIDTENEDADDYDPRKRPWYIAASEKDDIVWTKPYIFFTSQEPGITVAIPVHNTLGSALIGTVGVDIKITALSAFLETLDVSPRGQTAIVSENGDIIAHSEPDLMGGEGFNKVDGESDPILAQAAAQIPGGLAALFPGEIRLARFEAENEVWLGAVLRLELAQTPWTVVTYMPESDILAPLYQVRNIALLISLIALIATAVLGFVYGRRVMETETTEKPAPSEAA